MDLSALNNATAASTGASPTAPQKTVAKDDFLKLFVTQLQHQDPLSPMDSAGFTAQLAQFSSLEQLTNIHDGILSLLQFQSSLQNAIVPSLIGKKVGFQGKDATGAGTMQYGTVTGVAFDAGRTSLVIDGSSKIQPADIKEIL
jgi:flagellar basal-body rod modification protein FlgD